MPGFVSAERLPVRAQQCCTDASHQHKAHLQRVCRVLRDPERHGRNNRTHRSQHRQALHRGWSRSNLACRRPQTFRQQLHLRPWRATSAAHVQSSSFWSQIPAKLRSNQQYERPNLDAAEALACRPVAGGAGRVQLPGLHLLRMGVIDATQARCSRLRRERCWMCTAAGAPLACGCGVPTVEPAASAHIWLPAMPRSLGAKPNLGRTLNLAPTPNCAPQRCCRARCCRRCSRCCPAGACRCTRQAGRRA